MLARANYKNTRDHSLSTCCRALACAVIEQAVWSARQIRRYLRGEMPVEWLHAAGLASKYFSDGEVVDRFVRGEIEELRRFVEEKDALYSLRWYVYMLEWGPGDPEEVYRQIADEIMSCIVLDRIEEDDKIKARSDCGASRPVTAP